MTKKKVANKTAAKAAPEQICVRMYEVGFGDAFLLLIPSTSGTKRVLIDCGSIAKQTLEMSKIIESIVNDCKDDDGVARIDVVVATHRHRDHVSGFASALWKSVEVKEVWMPWTEHPSKPAARRIRDQQLRLGATLRELNSVDESVDAQLLDRFHVMALNAAPNENAMRTLHNGFAGSAKRRFLPETNCFPEVLKSDALPDVQVYVLGPSLDEKIIRALDPPKAETFLRAAAVEASAHADAVEPFGPEWWVDESEYTSEPRWAQLAASLTQKDRQALADLDEEAQGALAVALDQAINGTSLVLLLVVGNAHLLFPGDAQWGTWKRMLEDPDVSSLLQRISMLKVGHHGSENATPRRFVEHHLPSNIRAMVSTHKIAKWPDIPRQPLLKAMCAKDVDIARSDRDGEARADVFRVHPDRHYVETVIPMS